MPITPKPIEHRKGDKVKVAWPDGSVEEVDYIASVNDYQALVLRNLRGFKPTCFEHEFGQMHVRKRWLFR